MGYRSDAALATRRKYYDKMLREARTQKDSKAILDFLTTTGARCSATGDGENEIVILQWEYVKWYEEFPEVMYVEQWMEGEFDEKFEYAFVRFGDDPDDYEERCDDSYKLQGVVYMARAVHADVKTRPFIPVVPNIQPEDDDLPEDTDLNIGDFLNIKED